MLSAILLTGCSANVAPSHEVSTSGSNETSSEYEIPEDKKIPYDLDEMFLKYHRRASFDEFDDLKLFLTNTEEKAGMEKTLLLNPVGLDPWERPTDGRSYRFGYKQKEDGSFEDVFCSESFTTYADHSVGSFDDFNFDGPSPYSIRFSCYCFPLLSNSEIKSDFGYTSKSSVKFTYTQDGNVVGYVYASFHYLQVLDFVKKYLKENLVIFSLEG